MAIQCIAGSALGKMTSLQPYVKAVEWAEEWSRYRVAGNLSDISTSVKGIGWFAGVGPCRGGELPAGECKEDKDCRDLPMSCPAASCLVT
jgi:hypothetical protein